MIFHSIQIEPIVQVADKTRIDARKSFISKDEAAITVVEIEPEAGNGFIIVTGTSSSDWFLDWQYATAGAKVVSLRITTNGAPQTKSLTLTVVSASEDWLWSVDTDLVSKEPDVLNYVREGRNTFIDIHRAVQTKILDWIASLRIVAKDGTRLEKEDFIITEELRQLSCYWVLELIYAGLSNKPDDTYAAKAASYHDEVILLKNINTIQPDLNRDSEITESDQVDMRSVRAVRR